MSPMARYRFTEGGKLPESIESVLQDVRECTRPTTWLSYDGRGMEMENHIDSDDIDRICDRCENEVLALGEQVISECFALLNQRYDKTMADIREAEPRNVWQTMKIAAKMIGEALRKRSPMDPVERLRSLQHERAALLNARTLLAMARHSQFMSATDEYFSQANDFDNRTADA